MGIYRVVKAHDGVQAGEIRIVPDNRPYLREVLRLGLWERIEEQAEAPAGGDDAPKPSKPKPRKRTKR